MGYLARDFIKPLADGLKIHPSDILGGLPTFGNIYFVVPATEAHYNVARKLYDFKYNDGTRAFAATVAEAYSRCVSGRNDIIVLDGNVSHTMSAMLTVAKNRVHFVGADGGGRRMGQGAKLVMGVTTDTGDLGVLLNTGVRNTFRNIKFDSGNTVAESLYGVLEGGEFALYENCSFYKSTDLDESGAAELVLNGDSPEFKNCQFGSLADQQSGANIRATVLFTKGLAGAGKVARDVNFRDCQFWKKAGHVNNRFIYGAASNDLERGMFLENCSFINAKLAAAVPAQAIAAGASLVDGHIVLSPTCYADNVTKISTTTGVFVTGAAPAAGQGIAVNAA